MIAVRGWGSGAIATGGYGLPGGAIPIPTSAQALAVCAMPAESTICAAAQATATVCQAAQATSTVSASQTDATTTLDAGE